MSKGSESRRPDVGDREGAGGNGVGEVTWRDRTAKGTERRSWGVELNGLFDGGGEFPRLRGWSRGHFKAKAKGE